jgi:hypothetical protein
MSRKGLYVKAKLYQIEVCDSVLEYSHGVRETIWEIYIPEHGLYVNMAHGKLNVFLDDAEPPRFDQAVSPRDINFPIQTADELRKHLERKESLKSVVETLFDGLIKGHV